MRNVVNYIATCALPRAIGIGHIHSLICSTQIDIVDRWRWRSGTMAWRGHRGKHQTASPMANVTCAICSLRTGARQRCACVFLVISVRVTEFSASITRTCALQNDMDHVHTYVLSLM